MRRITTIVALLGITVQITACSGLLTSDSEARRNYMLEPYSGFSDVGTVAVWPALSISVIAVPGLDTDQIQALDSDARLIQYANARWTDFLPEVLTSVIRRSLASTGRFKSVRTNPGSGTDHWSLELEVQQFYGILGSANSTSSVEVRFEGNLRCNDREHQLQLNASEPVGEDRLATVVSAHQQALDATSRKLFQLIKTYCE